MFKDIECIKSFEWWELTVQQEFRIGDRERESAYAVLQEAYQLGYLNMSEFESRVSSVSEAKYMSDINPLLYDLPLGKGTNPVNSIVPMNPQNNVDTRKTGGPSKVLIGISMFVLMFVLFASESAFSGFVLFFLVIWMADSFGGKQQFNNGRGQQQIGNNEPKNSNPYHNVNNQNNNPFIRNRQSNNPYNGNPYDGRPHNGRYGQ